MLKCTHALFCLLVLLIPALVGCSQSPDASTLTAPSAEATADGTVAASSDPPLYQPFRRFGFGVSGRAGNIASFDVAQLGAGWYSDWKFSADPARPAGLEYVQLVPVTPGLLRLDQEALRAAVLAQRGSLWIIGNEPERRSVEGGSRAYDYAGLDPEEYAVIYQAMYQLIKGLDPTAMVAIGGVVQPSPVRLLWLDRVLDAYQELAGAKMPVDVWNIHMQLMREKRAVDGCDDCWGADIPAGIDDVAEGLLLEIEDNVNLEIFKSMIWDFRRWMEEKGEGDKPLIISEYGVLMPSEYLGATVEEGDKVVQQFMLDTFGFLLGTRDESLGMASDQNRLVQRWLWFSLNEVPYHFDEKLDAWIGFNGSLFDSQTPVWPGVMTPLGKAFAEYTKALSETTP